jgi:hypothetical protein
LLVLRIYLLIPHPQGAVERIMQQIKLQQILIQQVTLLAKQKRQVWIHATSPNQKGKP